VEEVRHEEIRRQHIESERRRCDTSPLCLAWCITTATAPQLQRTQIEWASTIQASKMTSPAMKPATRRHRTGLESPGAFITAASWQERESRQDFTAAVLLQPSTRIALPGLSDSRDRASIGHAAAGDRAHRRYRSVGAGASGIGQDQCPDGISCADVAFYGPSLQKRIHSSNYSDSRGAASPMRGTPQRTSDGSDEAATQSNSGEVAGQRQLQRQADTISHPTGRSSATQRPRLTGDSQKLSREEMICQRRVSLRKSAIQRHSDYVATSGDKDVTQLLGQYHKSTQRHHATLRRHVRRWCDSGPG
jgi:hypothetical protein